MNDLKAQIAQDVNTCGDFSPDAESERMQDEAIADQVANYPGAAHQVWAGWVWIVDGVEQRWSKQPTLEKCNKMVYEVVERLGLDEAFDN